MKYFFLIVGLTCFAGCESTSHAMRHDAAPAGSPPPQIATAEEIASAVAGHLSGLFDAQASALESNTETLDKLTGQIAVMNTQNKKLFETRKPETAGVAKAELSRAPVPPPVVWVVGPPNCVPCDQIISEGNADGRFQFIKRNANPIYDSIAANNGGYPVVVFATFDGPKYVCPYEGVDDLQARYLRFNGAASFSLLERKQPFQTGATNRAAPLFYSGNTVFDWPGDLRFHLTQPPHSLSPARVARMTDAECRRVHDAHHRGNWRAARSTAKAEKYAAKSAAKSDRRMQAYQRKQEREPGLVGGFFRFFFGGAPKSQRQYVSAGGCPSC